MNLAQIKSVGYKSFPERINSIFNFHKQCLKCHCRIITGLALMDKHHREFIFFGGVSLSWALQAQILMLMELWGNEHSNITSRWWSWWTVTLIPLHQVKEFLARSCRLYIQHSDFSGDYLRDWLQSCLSQSANRTHHTLNIWGPL